MGKQAKNEQKHVTPFWRNNRFLAILVQSVFAIMVISLALFFIQNALQGLNRLGIRLGLDFLLNPASITIEESLISFQPTDSYLRAILVGILNTLKVSVIGIVLATLLGVLIGMGRLSKNWLVRMLSGAYVEIFRNTPLLVQMLVWYFAVFLQLPKIKESMQIGPVYLNNRGAAIPWFEAHEETAIWLVFIIIGFVLGAVLWKTLLKMQEQSGTRKYPLIWSAGALLSAAVLIPALITQNVPFTLDTPVLGRFNFEGGYFVSANFLAVLIALVVYTAAYIAEIVRAGIQSVSKGQLEASQALGLKPATTMRLIVFPQAFRVIIPPVTNQYLNLTKNSSLAIAVGYRDLVSIANPIINQTGHIIEIMTVMILVYLVISLFTSLLMNLFNRKTKMIER